VVSGLAGTVLVAFPRRCRVSCRRAAVGQAGAPAAGAPIRARARTNELEAGKRRPAIGNEEGPGACRGGLPGDAQAGGVGLTSTHSAPARAAGRHDRAIRGPGCSVSSSSAAGPAQGILRARPGPGDPPACHLRCFSGGRAVAGCGAARSASVSRCQVRVRSLRATAVVAIFWPRRAAMAW
jgi:hypothetical protein